MSEVIKMEESIKIKVDETGRVELVETDPEGENKATKKFSTPNQDGHEFGRLFNDLKEGDTVILTFRNVRICSHCGKALEKKHE